MEGNERLHPRRAPVSVADSFLLILSLCCVGEASE